MVKIFISYRREDSAVTAVSIYKGLVKAFGKKAVFLDTVNIGAGALFPKELIEKIVNCDVFLAVIGKNWEGCNPETGEIRIDNPDDWVRYELELALRLRKHIIPIFLDGATFPAKLPDSIQTLSQHNGKGIRTVVPHFEDDMRDFVKDIAQIPVPKSSSKSEIFSRFLLFLFGIVILVMATYLIILLIPEESLNEALIRAQNFNGSNADWQPFSYRFEDGIEMVLVPAGCFQMGNDAEARYRNSEGLQLSGVGDGGQICFDSPYWIDRMELSQADFIRLEGQSNIPNAFLQNSNYPVEQITWFEAENFCAARDARLPSEAEWEYAARGRAGLIHPWGMEMENQRANFCDSTCEESWQNNDFTDAYRTTAPVGTYLEGKSWVGALDMAGNVWEWTNSIYRDYPYNPHDGRESQLGESSTALRVVRGGSWYSYVEELRLATRGGDLPTTRASTGFRCVRSAFSSTISDLSNYFSVNSVSSDLAGSDFAWISATTAQTASPRLIEAEIANVQGTFVYYPVELRSIRDEGDYSNGTLEARLQREMRDAEREAFDDLFASIYIEAEHNQEVFVIPYIIVDGIGLIPLGYGEEISTNQWALISWHSIIDSTLYNDTFINDLQAFYSLYEIRDLGFIRLAHILNVNMVDGTDIGFRFRLISDTGVGEEDSLQANIYISSLSFPR